MLAGEGTTVLERETDSSLAAADSTAALRSIARAEWQIEGPASKLRRIACAVYAVFGREREIASLVDTDLLACAGGEAIRAYLAGLSPGAASDDYLLAAVMLTWHGDRDGAYALFEESAERANAEGRYHVAVAAKERRSHHALLFGEVVNARSAIEEARRIAVARSLPRWRLRCGARLASLAFDAGDVDAARTAIAEALAVPAAGELAALFAPVGLELAATTQEAPSPLWSAERMAELALRTHDRAVMVAAAAAAIGRGEYSPAAGVALRRALLLCDAPSEALEFLGRVAERGEASEARMAVDSLRVMPAPHRPYVEAHFRLAHAHLLMRTAQTDDAVVAAGEAARAFDRLRLPRWSNEAMLLLVRDQGLRHSRAERRKTPSSLTKREHQVTLLIRRGASNREVAAALGITEHTVERHVSSILSRLGLRSRWQIADSPLP
ncbi:MAG TPA: helix-turn-helix transcriptional regulator [Verrucomicrobiae bacterium]|nr:helix-turn-helix transcriptional regulator [Verrucomicrobiae bacterium]